MDDHQHGAADESGRRTGGVEAVWTTSRRHRRTRAVRMRGMWGMSWRFWTGAVAIAIAGGFVAGVLMMWLLGRPFAFSPGGAGGMLGALVGQAILRRRADKE
ncbi:hypothetical protein [Streptomyces iconiensis]|uniref:Uncharacterized protein n=1 Tax=Streptomyces iconiensis TaxID=1384038 RepID=A0ABT6ZZD3_9ACTN|nr:hypothetical protein [Streptomyces iconiensis]MDJ1134217.1 hypothetical protein [Streptomyces iconiensis]